MARPIDADALETECYLGADVVHKEWLDNAPTIDAVPVIRCKDCKYYEETDETIGTCLLTASGAHVKGYCAWAECRGEHGKTD